MVSSAAGAKTERNVATTAITNNVAVTSNIL